MCSINIRNKIYLYNHYTFILFKKINYPTNHLVLHRLSLFKCLSTFILIIIWPISTYGRQTWSSRTLSPFQLHFLHYPILVQMNLQHSQSQPFDVCTCLFSLLKVFICGVSQREAVSTIKKFLVWLGLKTSRYSTTTLSLPDD